nr:hypothetical protein [Gemmatimonadota bacterium]NIQ57467.1 hypothetical protein [Gemmatimonadota bacterium]NIU77631.1 hypothetical protein [Gammaproteobacteria bacterium]NIX47942.1 hypothetical protein [Gemmatimonadota bacterium]
IAMLRLDDGSDRYYYGGFKRTPGTNFLGLGYIGYPVAIGVDDRDGTLAHEIGHNLGLPHAPCGDPAGPDLQYPYPDGFVGRFGYDRTRGVLLDPYRTYDLMGYCDPVWISDYNYERVLAYRDTSRFDAAFEAPETGSPAPPRRATLVVRGGVLDGALRLEPALEWDGPVTPPAQGPYALEGLDAAGRTLFTVAVAPRRLDHGLGSTFLVALPAEQARTDRLHTLRLTGPEGTVERTRTDRSRRVRADLAVDRAGAPAGRARVAGRWDRDAFPLAVVRDRVTGRIVAMSRTGRIAVPDDPARVEVLFSDGIGTRPGRVVRR